MLNVKNRSRTLFTLNLAKGVDYGDGYGPTTETLRLTDHAPDGTIGQRVIEKELPGNITWLGGETKSKLPEALRDHPDFLRACETGILLMVE